MVRIRSINPHCIIKLIFIVASLSIFKSFGPHLNGALLNFSGLAEAINSGLIVDGDEGPSGVDIVVGAGHIVALPQVEN